MVIKDQVPNGEQSEHREMYISISAYGFFSTNLGHRLEATLTSTLKV
jgi:hypothetical protein